MRTTVIVSIVLAMCSFDLARGGEAQIRFRGERKLNNLVAELLEVSSISKSAASFTFTCPHAGWIFISAAHQGKGRATVLLDKPSRGAELIVHDLNGGDLDEAVRYVAAGEHRIDVECEGEISVSRLVVKAIPELIHCGLGFNPAIKSYGLYDMEFLKKDVLPNVTTLIVPQNIELALSVIDAWHRQGKRFVAEVGINGQGKTADDHFKYWTGAINRAPLLDGIIINEFIVNNPSTRAARTPALSDKSEASRNKRGTRSTKMPSDKCVPTSVTRTRRCMPTLAAVARSSIRK